MAADPERQYVQRQAARSWTDTTRTNVVKRLSVRTAARDGKSWLRPKSNQVLGVLREQLEPKWHTKEGKGGGGEGWSAFPLPHTYI